jgi:hypothetical protein
MTRTTIFIAAGLALVVTLPAIPAQALVARTFLSAAGSDSNNCANVLTPCRHLAAAYAATAPNGEIYVLDPANYGSVTITGPVSIEGHGWASIAPPTGGNAITINANPGDAINIIGVVLDGTALAGTSGIVSNSGGSLTVRDSVIRNFGLFGIDFVPGASSDLFVSNTLIANFVSGSAIVIIPAGPGTVTGTLDQIEIDSAPNLGLDIVNNASSTIKFTVNRSVFAHNDNAIEVFGNSGTTRVTVADSAIVNNFNSAVHASGTGVIVRVTRSKIIGNGLGFNTIGGGTLISYGDNNLNDNTTDGSATSVDVYH